ncbi:MAG: GNAT family N-acetyltransferase [Solobacterium sp.]|nr:GNAT family N-acetyltransferase [Solobacterium sp.]
MNIEEIRIMPWTGQVPFSAISETIRRAHENSKDVSYDTTDITEEDLRERLANGGIVYVAADGDKVTGTMTICPQKCSGYYASGNAARIHYVAVDPEYAGNGIATRMLKECIRWAEENKIRTILWNTADNNHAAISFCQKNGFKKVECLKYKNVDHITVRLAYWLGKQPVSDIERELRYRKSKWKLTHKNG